MTRRINRRGFTLVEMLVATALIMFIMLILSEAFAQGLDAFRLLKGIGDMEERLRTAITTIRADLAADHFEGNRRLSDPNFWQLGNPREGYFSLSQGGTPTVGFAVAGQINAGSNQAQVIVRSLVGSDWLIQPGSVLMLDSGVFQESVQVANVNPGPPPTITVVPYNPQGLFLNNHGAQFLVRVTEGVDADFIPSLRATDHILAMTIKARGNRPEDFFSASLPYNTVPPSGPPFITSPFFPTLPNGTGNANYAATNFFNQAGDARYQDILPTANATATYKSQWAEVGYFLVPNGETANGTRLFALYRCQFVVVPDNRNLHAPPQNPVPNSPVTPITYTNWAGDGYMDMSCQQFATPTGAAYYYFNNPSDLGNFGTTSTPVPINPGQQTVTVPSLSGVNPATGMAWNIQPGSTLLVDSGLSAETVVVTGVGQNSFTANFSLTHTPNPQAGGVPIGVLTRSFLAAQAGLRGSFDPTNCQLWSATLVVTDVVSFDVRILPDAPGYNTDIGDVIPVPGWPVHVYDTAIPFSPTSPPYGIKAVQISLRVWDLRTQQTRQITMIQDM
jgi:prepilin-type N-terminal cleavage/methylation domain-containing protein